MSNPTTTLYRVTAPHFCAGFVVDEFGTVIRAADIIRYLQSYLHARRYCASKGWKLERCKS